MEGLVLSNATRGREMGQYGEGHSKQDIKQLINIERHMVLLFNASQVSKTIWLTNVCSELNGKMQLETIFKQV